MGDFAARTRERLPYLGGAALLVLLDQLTKALVSRAIPLHERIEVIGGFFDLTHVRNTGAAFGLFAGATSPYRPLLLNAVALAVFVAVLVYAFRSPVRWVRLQSALALILGGAIGNLIDRLRHGFVVDFLRFYLGSHEWPSFNVADSAITVGVALLAWDVWKSPAAEEEATRPDPKSA